MPSQQPPRAVPEPVAGVHPEITFETEGCVMAHWRGIFIGVWAIPSSLELIAEQDQVMKMLSARMPRFSSVHLVIKRAPLPAAAVRSEYEALAQRYAEQLACAAILLEGGGFWASAVRAFLTGVEMVERRLRSKTFGQLDALTRWLAPIHSSETGQRMHPDELRLALDWMLAHPRVRQYRGQ